MKFHKLNILGLALLFAFVVASCSDDPDDPKDNDDFNRSEMLSFWADHNIIPALTNYDETLTSLVSAKDVFVQNQTMDNLDALRTAWLDAYKSWQYVSIYDIGKAEEIGYRNFVNIYPTNAEEIDGYINSGEYNLTLPSTFDAQGLPALDYMLFGMESDDVTLLSSLGKEKHAAYLSELVDRLKQLNTQVLDDWKNGYKAKFIASDGSSATASTDKMINDFLYYYEKYFRAGKIGIPAGVFSGTAISTSVEAPYSGVYSKTLFLEAFSAVKGFFNGVGVDGVQGKSIKQYLQNRQAATEIDDIQAAINSQWNTADAAINELSNNFKNQVESDNVKMLAAYDELQKAVALLKVDMMQALNIQVDYVDADGD